MKKFTIWQVRFDFNGCDGSSHFLWTRVSFDHFLWTRASFDEVLERCPDEIQGKLLFHLDLLRTTEID